MNILIDKTKAAPIYIQIKEGMLDYIKKNDLPVGAPLPNVKKVATHVGVSTRTADQAFQSLIDDGICFRRPKKGTFIAERKNIEAKKMCGIISSYDFNNVQQNFLLSELYAGISKAAQKYDTDASMIFGDPLQSIKSYEMSQNLDFQGVMALEPFCLKQTIQLAEKYPSKIFIVLNYMLIGFKDTPTNVYAVVNDDFKGAYQLAEYYISNGCKSASLVTSELEYGDITYKERERGFIQALKDYGIDFDICKDKLSIDTSAGDINTVISKTYLKVKKYFTKGNRPDVIFAVNDIMAEGTEECIIAEELISEVEVAGYDCLVKEINAKHRFNSVKVNYSEMGRIGMQIINSNAKDYPKITKIAPELDIN
jgi:DNA-binding LacI/PurR family transcriptional regulator